MGRRRMWRLSGRGRGLLEVESCASWSLISCVNVLHKDVCFLSAVAYIKLFCSLVPCYNVVLCAQLGSNNF